MAAGGRGSRATSGRTALDSHDRDRERIEIVSYGRKGPGPRPWRLSKVQMGQVGRTVSRAPEVMVKVSGGARDAGGAAAHIAYLDRHGKLDVELDNGEKLTGKQTGREVSDRFGLDRQKVGPKPAEGERDARRKLVHNIILSMPRATDPEKVLEAARHFAREQFALQYRYAMVLHTDQQHPHVHLVVNAAHEYEPGKRLHIKKATLAAWRESFAQALRVQGVEANATPAVLRGHPRAGAKRDAMVHAERRVHEKSAKDAQAKRYERAGPALATGAAPTAAGAGPKGSTYLRAKVADVQAELTERGRVDVPRAQREQLTTLRKIVVADWMATADQLRAQGEVALAADVMRFVASMPPVQTDRERLARATAAAWMERGPAQVQRGDSRAGPQVQPAQEPGAPGQAAAERVERAEVRQPQPQPPPPSKPSPSR